MSDEPEISESGSPILRHQPREGSWEPPADDSATDEITAHIERHIGPVEFVYHEIASDLVHIDIHCVAPRPDRNFHTLITSGMSDRPMTVPAGAEDMRHAELMICLPPSWPLTEEALEDERWDWPLRWLKILARLPHVYETWLGWGHTIPNEDPPEPFAENTRLCCMMLLAGLTVPEAFHELRVRPDKTIRFYALFPLYREEIDVKLKQGSEKLLDLLDAAGVDEVLKLDRKNVGKKRFGLF